MNMKMEDTQHTVTEEGEITKDFIREVMSVPSCSGKEGMMKKFIIGFAQERGIDVAEDGKGNLLLVKGTAEGYYPCIANHMDTVQWGQGAYVDAGRRLDVLEREVGGRTQLYVKGMGIGADDKLGCALALALIDRLPVAKAVFFVEEEFGMLGSQQLDPDWFADVGFCLSFDSPGRNRSSKTCFGEQLYSEEFFARVLKPVCDRHGITVFNHEPYTDVVQIRQKTQVMCYNVGNGGYAAHSLSEYLVVEDAQAAFRFGLDLLQSIGGTRHWF